MINYKVAESSLEINLYEKVLRLLVDLKFKISQEDIQPIVADNADIRNLSPNTGRLDTFPGATKGERTKTWRRVDT